MSSEDYVKSKKSIIEIARSKHAMSMKDYTLITNFLVTLLCSLYIAYFIIYKQNKKHPFYYLWATGFALYALEILTNFNPVYINLRYILFVSASLAFSFGLLALIRKKSFLILLVSAYLAVFLISPLYFIYGLISFQLGTLLGCFLFYGIVALSLFYYRFTFGKIADKFIFGWLLLFLSNIILYSYLTDVFAIFSKLIILTGIIDQDFVILTQEIQKGISKELPPPPDVEFGKEGKLILINSNDFDYSRKSEWMMKKIRENIAKQLDTYIFSFQDVVPHKDLRRMKWISPEGVSVFLFSSSASEAKKEFTVLPMGIIEIGAALSEVIKGYSREGKSCTVIFTDLSLLIHVFGTYPVYNLVLNKMGSIRESQIDLFAFLHPKTHSDESIVPLFTNIAERIEKE